MTLWFPFSIVLILVVGTEFIIAGVPPPSNGTLLTADDQSPSNGTLLKADDQPSSNGTRFRADDTPPSNGTQVIITNQDNKIPSNDTADDDIEDEGWNFENNNTVIDTRRILFSKKVAIGRRPYMVYLQLHKNSAKVKKYRGWLCAGVIVHQSYVLTSAACVEDADKFFVVSGTTKYVESLDYRSDDCVCKHRRKVVWKCVPKNYKFDFQDSVKWSANDIAIIKVDKPFCLGVKEWGCQFATQSICYNNVSRELERSGVKAYIAGWGSGSSFREGIYRRETFNPDNAKCLQEAKVCIMDNDQCANKWARKFRDIITQYMICTKDVMKQMSEICDERYANCEDVKTRRQLQLLKSFSDKDHFSELSKYIDMGRHLQDPDHFTARRSSQGGFCENDHGGPLIVKYRGSERVIGVISACKIDPDSHSCHGPFLYTSVFKNRQFLSCSIYKDTVQECRRVFRTGVTHKEWTIDWSTEPDDDEDIKYRADADRYLNNSQGVLRANRNHTEHLVDSSKKEEKQPEKVKNKSEKKEKSVKIGNKKSEQKEEVNKKKEKEKLSLESPMSLSIEEKVNITIR